MQQYMFEIKNVRARVILKSNKWKHFATAFQIEYVILSIAILDLIDALF